MDVATNSFITVRDSVAPLKVPDQFLFRSRQGGLQTR